MNAAGEMYAPNWEQRPGHTTYKSQQYWVRQIPTQQIKITSPLNLSNDLCYAGTQLVADARSHQETATSDYE